MPPTQYNKFAHAHNMRVLIDWKSQNGRIEWKNGMEVYRMEQTGNRMEMVEIVDCNGWPFWASVGDRYYHNL